MNEPKRRGRPPKAKPCEDCGQTVGHYDDCPVGLGVQPVSPSQAYAMRVWNGQADIVPREERIRRCIAALEGQNLPTEGIEYPQ
jgi:hypothetical protein